MTRCPNKTPAKVVAPYGDWASPISISTVTGKTRGLSDPRVGLASSGIGYYLETRQNGESTIMQVADGEVSEVLPSEYYAGNDAYEYGGSTYEILGNGRIIFTHGRDNTVNILNPETREVTYLTGKDPVLRYSDFSPNINNPWVLAYEEDRTNNSPAEVRSYVVAINIETGEVKRVVSGADFYFTPKFNPEGTKLVWIQWNRPEMPFDESELYLADFDAHSCSVSNTKKIQGKGTGLAEPHWGPDGTLWFGAEKYNYRSLFRIPPGAEKSSEVKHGLGQGSRTYTPVSSRHVVAAGYCNGVARLMTIDADTGSWDTLLADEISDLGGRSIARLDDKNILVTAVGPRTPNTLRKVNIESGESTILRTSSDEELPPSMLCQPTSLQIESKGSPKRPIYGFLWLPRNDCYVAPRDSKPPLIIEMHGGPTSAAGPGLDRHAQYFTSRGYAYLKLNYTGSMEHGREYRQSLFGNWGIVDAADAAEFADYLRQAGLVGKVGITGISAGGYGTLQCVTRHPETFDAGFCVSGISELEGFDKLTHKLEMDYPAALVLHKGMSEEEKAKVYRERSALYHVDKIKTPLALYHSREDTVVPIYQAEKMFEALKEQIDVKMIKVSGDGHGLGRPQSRKIWISEAEAWWRSHLL
ncbi:hypothetical protein NLU13_1401 [Sarocladium strictum]|uniref:Peptidase S9 prolyl oligopeptidase catalytic domain-containing protein n=1 Tax=Sarocladium strictum TaxID=5046 RepID=A0AA39GSH1_SARSR|nr:hypothetical protein NLU13_1401 [Sarocladium strictum]